MNKAERFMLDQLLRARDNYGVVALKAEFEAEGSPALAAAVVVGYS